MLQSITGNSFLMLTILIFVAIVLLLEGLYLLWKTYRGPEAKKIEQRLQALSASADHSKQASVLKNRMLSDVPLLERLLLSMPRASSLDKFILQSGLNWTVSKLLLSAAVLGVTGYAALIATLHQSPLFGLIAGGISAAIPLLYVQWQRNRRLTKIEQQLPDALDLISRSLRAGHALPSSLQMTGEEMPEPIGNEFRIVHDEVNFGVSLGQALTNLNERVPITDLRYFVVAVLIQRESGGNLAEVLGNLSKLVRNRLKLLGKLRVLSADGRMSAWILLSLPFVLGGLLNLVNPDFMSPLWKDPIGIGIVKAMLINMMLGAIVIRKIVKIRI